MSRSACIWDLIPIFRSLVSLSADGWQMKMHASLRSSDCCKTAASKSMPVLSSVC